MLSSVSRQHSAVFFFFTNTATTQLYTLSLHDALPISYFLNDWVPREGIARNDYLTRKFGSPERYKSIAGRDRKSTRLNSSHVKISYAVFCLKKKKIIKAQLLKPLLLLSTPQ